MKSSGASRSSKRARAGAETRPGVSAREVFVVFLFASLVIAVAATFVYANGWTLFYGDAEAHLNIARRIVDSRTPGPDQIGTVWLPLPHLLMLPAVAADSLWFSGLAGVIPSAICYVIALLGLYTAVKLSARVRTGGVGGCGCVRVESERAVSLVGTDDRARVLRRVLRPAGRHGLVRAAGGAVGGVAAGFFSNWCSLTRYEGWFLIPFVAAYIFVARPERRLFRLACSLRSLASRLRRGWLTTGGTSTMRWSSTTAPGRRKPSRAAGITPAKEIGRSRFCMFEPLRRSARAQP